MEPDTNSPTPPQGSQIRHVAMNIVNQLGDHWAIPVADRQAGNDKADDFVTVLITAQVQEAEARGRREALELVAKQSGWEDSYDHFARQLGLPAKYGHSCQNCAALGDTTGEEA